MHLCDGDRGQAHNEIVIDGGDDCPVCEAYSRVEDASDRLGKAEKLIEDALGDIKLIMMQTDPAKVVSFILNMRESMLAWVNQLEEAKDKVSDAKSGLDD
jgi:hypothetical protein